jgi:hypothetical protein
MTLPKDDMNGEKRKQLRLEKLGTNNPRCTCGETDWRCMQQHHDAGQKNDPTVVILCANCHCKVTDLQKGHPETAIGADRLLTQAGNLMLGLADMLLILIDQLRTLGHALLDRANGGPNAIGGAS